MIKRMFTLVCLALAAFTFLSGCATSTFKIPATPRVTVDSAQYTSQIRPLILVVETVFAQKLSPVQIGLVYDLVKGMDEQAAKGSTIDVLPVLLAVGAPALGNEVGKHITLTENEQLAAKLGLGLLTQLYGEQPSVKAMLPLLSSTLDKAAVVPRTESLGHGPLLTLLAPEGRTS